MKNTIKEQTLFTTGIITEAHSKLFKFLERHNPSEYDKIMDKVYNETNIGGGTHRHFDGSHTFAGSYEEIKEATGDVEMIEYFKSHFNELVTPEGIPLFTLDKEEYYNFSEEISEIIGDTISGGQIRTFIRDINSFNAGELTCAGLGSLFLFLAIRSGNPKAISRVVAANLCIGVATANPLQIFIGLSSLAHGVYNKKIKAWELLKGATPIIAGALGYQIAEHTLDLAKNESIIFAMLSGIATSVIIEKLDADKKKIILEELGENKNYLAIMTPGILRNQLEIISRKIPKLSIGI